MFPALQAWCFLSLSRMLIGLILIHFYDTLDHANQVVKHVGVLEIANLSIP